MASSGGIAINVNRLDIVGFDNLLSNTDSILSETKTLSSDITDLRQLLLSGKITGKAKGKQSSLFSDIRNLVTTNKNQLKMINDIKGKLVSEVQEIKNSTTNLFKKPFVRIQKEISSMRTKMVSEVQEIKNSTENLLKKPLVSIQNELQSVRTRVISSLKDVKTQVSSNIQEIKSSTENLFKKPFNRINKKFQELFKIKKERKSRPRVPLSPKNRKRLANTASASAAASSSLLNDIGDAASVYDTVRGNKKGTALSSPKGGLGKVLNGGSKLLGGLSKGATRAIPIAGAALGALSIGSAVASGDSKEIGSSIGGTGGAIVGGVLGSVLGPAGTVAGAALGGMIGDWIGEAVGGFFEETNEKVDDNFNDLNKYNKKQEKEDKITFDSIVSNVTDSVKNAWDSAVTKISNFFDSIKLFFYDILSKVPFIGDYFKGKADVIRTAQSANVGGSPAGGGGAYSASTSITPDLKDPNNIGSLAAKYESQGSSRLAADIGDGAGVSFGKYQIATSGTRGQFLKYLDKQGVEGAEIAAQLRNAGFETASGKGHQSIDVWKNLVDQGKIQKFEEGFGRDFYYGTAFNGIKSQSAKDMINKSPTLQKALFSMALQGQHGAYKGINEGFKEGMNEEDLLRVMYNNRLQRAENNKNNERKGLINGLRNRLSFDRSGSEANLALNMLRQERSGGGNVAQNGTNLSPNTDLVSAARNVLETSSRQYKLGAKGQGGKYDCTGFVNEALRRGQFPPELVKDLSKVPANSWGRVLEKWGFEKVAFNKKDSSNLVEGDILWKSGAEHGHVEMYAGNNKAIGAHSTDSGISERDLSKGVNFTYAYRAPEWMRKNNQNAQAVAQNNNQGDQSVPVAQNIQPVAQNNNQGGQPVPVAQNDVKRGPLRGDATELLKYLDELDKEQNKGGQPLSQKDIDAKVNAKLKEQGVGINTELGAEGDGSVFNVSQRMYRQRLYEAVEQGKDLNSEEFDAPKRRSRSDLMFFETGDGDEDFDKLVAFEKKLKEKQAAALEPPKPAIQNPATAPKPEQQAPQMASSHTQPKPATPAPAPASTAPQPSENGGSDPFMPTDYSLQAYRIDPLSPVGA